jgi:pre-60S factor REI1
LATKAVDAATIAKASFEKFCEPCHRNYSSENAYNNHIGSQKHKVNVTKSQKVNRQKSEVASVMSSTFSLGEAKAWNEDIDDSAEEEFSEVVKGMKATSLKDVDPISRRPTRPHASGASNEIQEHPVSPVDSDDAMNSGELTEEYALRQCLFCNKNAPDLESNLVHMQKGHGLFIPEKRYLIDFKGLVFHLSRKVHDDYRCLYCNRLKWSEDGIKKHMRDASHCKIAYESEEQQLELGDFYDFRSTYSDADDDIFMEGADDHSGSAGDENGWETSSTVSSVPTEELGKMYYDTDENKRHSRLQSHRHHSHAKLSKHRALDGFHSHAHHTVFAVYHDEVELHLPTGRVAGHRSLNRYYRQNLRNYPTQEERIQRLLAGNSADEDEDAMEIDTMRRGRTRGHDQRAVTRADGGLGMLAVSESKKREVQALEKREKRREHRAQAKVLWRTNKMNNHQKHFRDPLLQ